MLGRRPCRGVQGSGARGLGRPDLPVSASGVPRRSQCGYRYWLRHVCGFQPPIVPELGFGKVLHHMVAELARTAMDGGCPEAGDVERILDDSFYLPFAGPVPAAKLRRAAQERSLNYLHRYGAELSRVVEPEARFEVPLANARVRGRIDLVLRTGDGGGRQVELVDFKTSSNRPPAEVHQNQMRLYAAAAERLGLEPVALWIHDLDDDLADGEEPRIRVRHDDREREAFAGTLQGWVEGIQGGRFGPTGAPGSCRACDFRRFCRYAPEGARRAHAGHHEAA
ncbi:MAG: RecB family exonuclease [Acidimicrobiales bacterium]